MKHTIKIFGLIGLIGLMTYTGCNEENPSSLTIVSVASNGTDLTTGNNTTVDLNGVASATNVPPDGVITITFNKSVDAASVTSANVSLNNGTDDAAVTVAANGVEVTLTPTVPLLQGTIYTLLVSSAVNADDGGNFTATSRTFTTAGTAPPVVPQADNLVVYLSFNGVVEDEFNHTILNNEVTLATDRFGNFESSANFNGTTNYVGIEYGTDMSNANTTVSYWIKVPASAEYTTHAAIEYVTFAIGGNSGTWHGFGRFECCGNVFDYLKYYTNHVNSGSAASPAGSEHQMKNEGTPEGDQVVEVDNIPWLDDNTNEWMHIVTSWNAALRRKSFYVNGVLSTAYNVTPTAEYTLDAAVIDVTSIDLDATNSRNLYLGAGVPYWATKTPTGIIPFRGDVPHGYKGQMDDFRMYSVALTDSEVLSLYNAEKP